MNPPMIAELASKLRRSSDDDVADRVILRGGNASFGIAGLRHTVSFAGHFEFDPCMLFSDHGAKVSPSGVPAGLRLDCNWTLGIMASCLAIRDL